MRFDAPWATVVKVVSFAVTALLLAIAFAVDLPASMHPLLSALVRGGPLAILLGAALFTVRGYRLEGSSLLVERLLWSTDIPLAGLRSARHDPMALKGSIRVFGNGGLYGFTGLFSNKTLGRYRAWATDPERAVVLRFETRAVVVTPGRPEDLVAALAPYCSEGTT